VTGSFQIGVQATDSNGCMSANTILTLTIAAPKFTISPLPANGLSTCAAPGPGFPTGIVPTVSFNSVNSYEVNVTIYNSGNVAGIANLNFAILGGFPTLNSPLPGIPIILGTSGSPLAPGQCVSLTFFYPTSDYASAAPLAGFTLANVPQVLRLSGTYNIIANAGAGPTTPWSLTDRAVLLSGILCCTNTAGVLSGSTSYNPNAGGPIGVGGNP